MLTKFYRIWHTHTHARTLAHTHTETATLWHWFWLLLAWAAAAQKKKLPSRTWLDFIVASRCCSYRSSSSRSCPFPSTAASLFSTLLFSSHPPLHPHFSFNCPNPLQSRRGITYSTHSEYIFLKTLLKFLLCFSCAAADPTSLPHATIYSCMCVCVYLFYYWIRVQFVFIDLPFCTSPARCDGNCQCFTIVAGSTRYRYLFPPPPFLLPCATSSWLFEFYVHLIKFQ